MLQLIVMQTHTGSNETVLGKMSGMSSAVFRQDSATQL